MDINHYQLAAMRTCIHIYGSVDHKALAWNALGLTGEAGEVADEIKKVIGHGHELNKDKLKKELGDVLWYIAALCNDLGLAMGDVAQANIDKLKERYPDGFSQEKSKNRKDGGK
ncbi:MAG TPA: nucleoside triphosphate pyrophosphohydrolase family protein [Gemmatales bacterium]|nr:nucleoside triphosphate pyrophosphohydrolase family protein [Gemmatales bacterium]